MRFGRDTSMSGVWRLSSAGRAVSVSGLAAVVTAVVLGVVLAAVAVGSAYLLGGGDAVLGRNVEGFTGMFFISPIHTATLCTIRDCMAFGIAAGVIVGVLTFIVYSMILISSHPRKGARNGWV